MQLGKDKKVGLEGWIQLELDFEFICIYMYLVGKYSGVIWIVKAEEFLECDAHCTGLHG